MRWDGDGLWGHFLRGGVGMGSWEQIVVPVSLSSVGLSVGSTLSETQNPRPPQTYTVVI